MTGSGSDSKVRIQQWLRSMGLLGEDGRTFIVDAANGTGDMATSQEAVDACVDNRGDVIIRKPGGEAVTSVLNFNKKGVSYVPMGFGASPLAKGELFSIYSTTLTEDPVAIITKRMFIAGIAFAGADAGSLFYSGAALLVGGDSDATPFGTHVYRCRFPKWNLDNRIGLAVEGSSDVVLEENYFEGVGADFDSGIYVQGACANIDILRNTFRDCTEGIQFGSFAGGGPDCLIQGNVAMHGSLLNAPSAAVGAVIDNYIPTKDVAAAYGGDSLATLEGRGLWFANNHYSETP